MLGTLPPSAAPGKPIWQSKTFWLNVVGAAALALDSPLARTVPAEYVGLALAVLNVLNRFFTDVPIVVMKGE